MDEKTSTRIVKKRRRKPKKEGVLSKIRRIKISGPKDFSMNHDLYITGKRHG